MRAPYQRFVLVGLAALGFGLFGCQTRPEADPAAANLNEMADAVRVGVPWDGEVDLVMLGDWGYGTRASRQKDVARQIARYGSTKNLRFDAAILLGDNFYQKLPGGVRDRQWTTGFQHTFSDVAAFGIPFYVAFGNHDYGDNKVSAQLDYARRDPTQRWTAPAKWYAVRFPTNNPLVTILVIDTNLGRLSPAEQRAQLAWMKREIGQAKSCPWLLLAGHHPLFGNGKTRESPALVEIFGHLLKSGGIDFYVAGHDHGLQHIEMPAWPNSFLISGGGGAKLHKMPWDDKEPFSRSQHGFLHLHLTTNAAVGRFVSVNGKIMHEFSRDMNGGVKVLIDGGRDKPSPGAEKEEDE